MTSFATITPEEHKQGLEPDSSFFPAVFGQTVSRCST